MKAILVLINITVYKWLFELFLLAFSKYFQSFNRCNVHARIHHVSRFQYCVCCFIKYIPWNRKMFALTPVESEEWSFIIVVQDLIQPWNTKHVQHLCALLSLWWVFPFLYLTPKKVFKISSRDYFKLQDVLPSNVLWYKWGNIAITVMQQKFDLPP